MIRSQSEFSFCSIAEIKAKSSAKVVSRPAGVVEVISASCWFVRGALEGVVSDFLVDSGSTYTIVDIGFFRTLPDGVKH